MDTTILLTGIILIVLGVTILFLLWPRRKKLSESAKQSVRTSWNHAKSLPDAHRRVLEGDKVLDKLLTALGYTGTLGEKLKKADKQLPDINAVWRAHKLRNRIAHETGITVSAREEAEAMAAFERVIRKFTQ